VGKNKFKDCQGTIYHYNIPYEENEEEEPEEDDVLEIEAEPDSETAAEAAASKEKPKGKAKTKAAAKTKNKPPEARAETFYADWESGPMMKPPPHIASDHVYSNVYRLRGKVRQDWIGNFRNPKA
ncbi:unnamed protein product, partial [Symbiodinium necroappetens]